MAGRPPKEKSFANMLNIAIAEATEDGGSKLRAVADKLVDLAMKGDMSAIKEVADRLDGKAVQQIAGDAVNPLTVVARIVREIHDPRG